MAKILFLNGDCGSGIEQIGYVYAGMLTLLGHHVDMYLTQDVATQKSLADRAKEYDIRIVNEPHNGGQYSTHWTADRTENNGAQYAQHLASNDAAKYATHKQQNRITVFGAHDSAAQSSTYVSDNASRCPTVDNYAVGTYNGGVRSSHLLNVNTYNEGSHFVVDVWAVHGSDHRMYYTDYKYPVNSVNYLTHETCHNSEAHATYNNGVTSL